MLNSIFDFYKITSVHLDILFIYFKSITLISSNKINPTNLHYQKSYFVAYIK